MAILFGCATAPERIAQTRSGKPEVSIKTNDIEAVKSELISRMMEKNYLLEDDSKYRMTFKKEVEGFGAQFAAQLLVGTKYGTTPEVVAVFNLMKLKDGLRVIGFVFIFSQSGFGQTKKEKIDNNKTFNDVQTMLNLIKSTVERI
jgi:hypothetical protein